MMTRSNLLYFKVLLFGYGLSAVAALEDSSHEAYVNAEELLLVQVVHRHGERTSLHEIPEAGRISPAHERPREAQLTARGVGQMYDYGGFIRERYHKFFEDGQIASSRRIKIISSATDRTISSAQALAAGLLPPNGTQRQWSAGLGIHWNPFPVYTRPARHDSLLLSYKDDCPVFTELRRTINQLPIGQQLEAELQNFKNAIVAATGIIDYNFYETSAWIEDALRYMHSYPGSGQPPGWLTDNLLHNFQRIANVGGNSDHVRTRFRVGNLLRELFDRMDTSRIMGRTNEEVTKMVLYSGHDENVAGILAALGLYNYTIAGPNFGIPEFTASIIIEFFRNETVRFLLKNNPNDTSATLKVLTHPRCVTFCPLDKLHKLLQDIIITEEKWREECGISKFQPHLTPPPLPSNPEKIGVPEAILISGGVIALTIIASVLLASYALCRRRSRQRRLQTQPNNLAVNYQPADSSS